MIRSLRKTALLLTALTAGAVACTGGSDSTPLFELESGGYEMIANDTPFDGCWTDNAVFPPTGIGIHTFALAVGSNTGTIDVTRPSSYAAILPALVGVREINAVFGSGTGSFTVGSNCVLALDAFFSGAIVGDDLLDLDFTSTLTATAVTGTASSCATYAGTIPTSMGVPFPTLDPPHAGSCSFRQRGRLTPYP